MTSELVAIGRILEARSEGRPADDWSNETSNAQMTRLTELIASEVSPYHLGELLRCDVGLGLPVDVVRKTYLRLFELGVQDVHTQVCYARYLLLYGPEWDQEANEILARVEPAARAAGVWMTSTLGHHPVFFQHRLTLDGGEC